MAHSSDYLSQSIDEDDVSLLINALCEVLCIAESKKFRDVSQKGYGDIQEIVENVLEPFRIHR